MHMLVSRGGGVGGLDCGILWSLAPWSQVKGVVLLLQMSRAITMFILPDVLPRHRWRA